MKYVGCDRLCIADWYKDPVEHNIQYFQNWMNTLIMSRIVKVMKNIWHFDLVYVCLKSNFIF